MQIRDRLALGVFAGAAATVPQVALNAALVRLGLCHYYDYQISAGVYILKHLTYTVPGMLLGLATWTTMAATLGVVIANLLHFSGTDYWWLKGMAVSNGIMFTLIYGFFYATEAPKVVPWDIATNWALFADNLVFGVVAALLVLRWGDQPAVRA